MAKEKYNSAMSAAEIIALKDAGKERDGKAIVAQSRVSHSGQKAVNQYILEDGTEVIEDDSGNAVDVALMEHPKVAARKAKK